MGDEVSIFFTEAGYTATQDVDGCVNFHTQINITAPVDYFGVCQYRLTWDPTLFMLMDVWTAANGAGSAFLGAYDNGSPIWVPSDTQTVTRTGDIDCPNGAPNMGDGKNGCGNFVTGWMDQMSGGNGVNITVPDNGPAEAYFIYIRWRTTGTACDYGNTVNTGTSDIEFIPTLMCACSKDAVVYDLEDVYTLYWVDTSVTVN